MPATSEDREAVLTRIQESPWVEREWRCAYAAKGIDFIDPVPLEPAAGAPPPAELARKHFNEPLLAYCDDPAHRHAAG